MIRPGWILLTTTIIFVVLLEFVIYKLINARTERDHSGKSTGPGKLPKLGSNKILRTSIIPDTNAERVKAAFVILARNSDLDGLKKTIPMLEDKFNSRFNYPYVFLNDKPFSEAFKLGISELTKSKASFGLVPKDQWEYPSWINKTHADECRQDMEKRNIIYGGSLPYRHMCRYNSGFFFRHPLLDEFDYYWRVEPSVEFFCNIDYDPFLFMKKNKKKYGFVIMLHEYIETIPTLWETTKKFMEEYKSMIPERNSLKLVVSEDGNYNKCHFWSNFEIGDLNFLRAKEYLAYFNYLDKAGGFFYERWGDAPVHSIAASMLLPIEQIHYFQDIGYYHGPFYNCPTNPALQLNCHCDPGQNINTSHECFKIFKKVSDSVVV